MSWRGSGNFRPSGGGSRGRGSQGSQGGQGSFLDTFRDIFGAGGSDGPSLPILIGVALCLGLILLVGMIASQAGGGTATTTQPVAVEPTAAPAAAATEAPAPTVAAVEPTAAPVTITADEAGAATTKGDAAAGATIFSAMPTSAVSLGAVNCSTCHNIAPGSGTLVGPSLSGVGKTAETRVSGLNAVQYLRSSIVAPNGYVVAGFQPGLMTQTFGKALTPEQIDDLIAYMLTLP